MDKFQWNFQENVAYDNIESHKKTGLQPFSGKYIFKKP